MDHRKLLVIVGATGTQGSAIVSHFLQNEPSYQIRGLTRNVKSSKAKALISRGVQMVQADLNDLSSLRSAFQGAFAIFAYTDSAGCSASAEAKDLLATGRLHSLPEAAEAVEIQHGRNIADAASNVGASLERLVWSTQPDAAHLSRGKLKVYEMRSKARISEYMQSLQTLDGKLSSVVFVVFADSIARFYDVFGWQKLGERHYTLRVPITAKAPLTWIDMPRDAGSYVSALLAAPAGLSVEAVSGYLSFHEIMAIVSEKHGVKIDIQEESVEDWASADDRGLLLDVAALWKWVELYTIDRINTGASDGNELAIQDHPIKRSNIKETMRMLDWSALFS